MPRRKGARRRGAGAGGRTRHADTAKPLKTVGSYWPYATTVWDYVNRAMPFDQPGLLKPPEVYAVVAYILNLNGIIGNDQVMDAKSLAEGEDAEPQRLCGGSPAGRGKEDQGSVDRDSNSRS